ncbi:hypothetical protein [Pseudomonas sp.]|uniref:hypothetical protein n=1 Tax=Pseudomonas sp. TaxID=306 RepID=UPI00286BEA89|nr:hypothetical protein [Pseudomonas sp.]
MDIELDQFQKDLLESVREMNENRAVRVSETGLLQIQDCIDTYVSSLVTQHKNVSLKPENSDT